MNKRSLPLSALLSIVPYFHSRGAVYMADAARDLGMTEPQLREALWQLWSCGLPGYGPGELIDLAFSAEDLDQADLVEVTFTAGIDRPVRLTAAEAVTLETGLAVFLDHPEVIDQGALKELMALLGHASEAGGAGQIGDLAAINPDSTTHPAGPRTDSELVRDAVQRSQALRFVYFSASSDTSSLRMVDPARLSVADGHTYVRGVERATGQWRTFRTDRMKNVELIGPRRELTPEPAADTGSIEYLEQAWVRGSATWFLDEFPFRNIQATPGPGGDIEVSIPYFDRSWLVRFLLGHADVITPSDPGLRDEIAKRALRALAAQQHSGAVSD